MAILSKNEGTVMVKADRKEIHDVIHSIEGLNIFDVVLDGDKTTRVILKDVQRDPVSRRVVHIALQEVAADDIIRVAIPVRVDGTPQAVTKRMATLMTPMNQVDVKGKVSELPNEIYVDASEMKQNDRIIIGDLKGYDQIEFLTSPDAVVATTKQLRGMAELEEGAAEGAEGEAEGEGGEATESEEASE